MLAVGSQCSAAGEKVQRVGRLEIEICGDAVRVCGEASRYEVRGAGTPQESHYVPVAHPVLWTARLRGGREER